MAASPQDPRTAHSLWLQRRSIRRTNRRIQWRSDWTPFGLVFLLLGLLILVSMFLPFHESVDPTKQADSHQRSMVGAITEP